MLEGGADIDVVAVGCTWRDLVRIMVDRRVDVVVVGIAAADAGMMHHLIDRLAERSPWRGPRLVGVVSGDQDVADLLGGTSATVITSRVSPECLRDVVAKRSAGRVWALSPQLIRPPAAAPRAASASRMDTLTGRERDVLRGIESGLSTREIAVRLGITTNTVRTHAQRLMSKLAVHSRVHAAAFAAGDLPVPAGSFR